MCTEKRKDLGERLGHDVVAELWQHVFCDVPGFLEAMFPVDEGLISRVHKSLRNVNCYMDGLHSPCWARSPIHTRNKTSSYALFFELVEDIKNSLDRMETDKPILNDLKWHVLGSTTPATRDPYVPDV